MGQPRLNLKGVTTLLIDSDLFTRGLVANMLRGFGMDSPTVGETGKMAQHHLQHHYADLVIMEGGMPDMPAADLIKWIRKQEKSPFRFVPIIVMSGYTQLRLISAARDAGANLVVKKPVSPAAIFDRITWVARTARPFIETSDYIGPDRRFKNIAAPDGKMKRDSDETEAEADAGNTLETQQSLNSAA